MLRLLEILVRTLREPPYVAMQLLLACATHSRSAGLTTAWQLLGLTFECVYGPSLMPTQRAGSTAASELPREPADLSCQCLLMQPGTPLAVQQPGALPLCACWTPIGIHAPGARTRQPATDCSGCLLAAGTLAYRAACSPASAACACSSVSATWQPQLAAASGLRLSLWMLWAAPQWSQCPALLAEPALPLLLSTSWQSQLHRLAAAAPAMCWLPSV